MRNPHTRKVWITKWQSCHVLPVQSKCPIQLDRVRPRIPKFLMYSSIEIIGLELKDGRHFLD